MRELLYRQCKCLPAAEHRITGQEHDWAGELNFSLRVEVPGLQARKVIFAWANLCLPVEGDPLAVTKPIDDRDCSPIVSAGVVTDIDDNSFQLPEVTGNLVKSGGPFPLTDAFQFENSDVAEFPRPAVAKHPGFGLRRLPEPIGNESLLGGFEELPDLLVREFPSESWLSLRVEISFLPMPLCFDL